MSNSSTEDKAKNISMDASVLPSAAQDWQVPDDAEIPELSTDQLLEMYRKMVLIRRLEESLLQLAESGKIGGAMHTAVGHEANAVGAAAALKPGDYLTCTYRGHHHSLARGMDPGRAIAEVLGRADGFAKGKGGSMHFIDPSLGLMGANGIVGAQVPHAAGMALASKLRGEDHIAITFFGDGAIYQGLMHETFNMAQKWSLPVIFYCENNRYSEMTPISRTSSVEHLYRFVEGYGMRSMQINGNYVETVYQAVAYAAQKARAGEGPTFIEGITYRLAGHMSGDLESYREKEEIEQQRAHEPMVVLRKKLVDRGVDEAAIGGIESDADGDVEEATEFAQNSPWPELDEAYTDVYAL